MPKTRRDLLLAIADKIGGERGKRMREALRNCNFAAMMDRPMTDAEYEQQMQNAERELPSLMAKLEQVSSEKPGSWGFPN